MKKGMKKILSVAIVLAMTMSLAACGGGTKETQGQASSETAAASGESAGTEAGETSVGEIKRGGTLTLRRTGTTPINPTQVIAPAGDMMTYSLFFETLTWFNEEDYSAQPSLAESWEWSDDSLSLTMKLKEGVNFFDGTPVNAEAVKTTMEYYMDPDTAHAQASYLANVDNVEVVDDYTVKFNFSAPDSSFLTAMAQPIGIILAPAAIEKFKSTNDPEVVAREGGCGPFKLSEFLDGESLTAVKNENYYKMGADGQALPYLDSVVVQIIGDEAVMAANMESGDIDAVDFFYDQNYIDEFNTNDDIVLYKIASQTQYILYMNMQKEPFDNVKVREALCYAFDRDECIDVLLNGDGFKTPTIVLPTQTFYRDGKIYDYNPEKSKELLKEAGYPDGVTIEFYYGTYGSNKDIAELLQSQAAAAGFNLTLCPTDGASVKQLWASYNEDTPAGIRMNELGHPKPSPYIQMDYTFGQNALQNSSKWFSDDLAALLKEISQTTDETAQNEKLTQLQEMVEQEIPIVSLYTAYKFSAYRTWVEGLKYNGEGTMIFTEAWLNK